MEKFKDVLRRGCWGMFLRDLFIALYVIFSIPAIWILYVYDFLDMDKAELIAAYWSLLLVASLPFVLLVWVIVLLRRKMTLGYLYIRQDKRVLINAAGIGIRIYEKVNQKGKNTYEMVILRRTITDFIIRFMGTYDLLEPDTKNDINGQRKDDNDYKNDYEEIACEFVKKKYPEWVILRAEK